MTRVYEEIVNFLAKGSSPSAIAEFSPSDETRNRVADLLRREKTSGLTPDEQSELAHFLEIEHVLHLAKARAREHCEDE